MSTSSAILLTLLAQVATVIELAHRHLTIWIAWWPVASIPALEVLMAAVVIVVAGCAALLFLRATNLRGAGRPTWATAGA